MQPLESSQFQLLWRAKMENRLPQAILFSGMAGVGKTGVADYFSKALCCEQVDKHGKCCDHCHSCRLQAGRSHPNIIWIQPEKPGHAIKVDQMREVKEFVNQSSFMGNDRVVIIHPADNMNVNAANALLKTLEEPANHAIIILVNDQNGPIPATILSRCHKIHFPQIPHEVDNHKAERDLLYKGMLCLLAPQADPISPITLAQAMQDIPPLKLIDLSLSWVMDLVGLQLKTNVTSNQDYRTQLESLTEKTAVSRNIDFMTYLQSLRSDLARGINLNKQLMTESLLVKWMDCLHVSR